MLSISYYQLGQVTLEHLYRKGGKTGTEIDLERSQKVKDKKKPES